MKNLISIVIPSFNRANLLKYGLLSLSQQIIPFNFETIILNDGLSNDGTEEVCNQYKDKLNLHYIYTGQRNSPGNIKWRVPGYAFNIGIKQAKGNIIIITQPEIFHFRNDNVLRLLNIYDINSKKLKNKKFISYPSIMKDDIPNGFLDDLKKNNEILTKSVEDYNKLGNLKAQYLFFMAFHKSEFMDIGGFDEDFIGNCWDDEDMIHRFILNGCSFIKRDVKVIHLYHPRHNYKSEEIMKWWHYNKKLYNERYTIAIRNQDKEWGQL